MRSLSISLSAAIFLFASLAFADAVPPPPSSCPEGSQGATCHGGPHCAPRKCSADADCKTGEACEDRKLCATEINCASGWQPPDAGPRLTPNITGACKAGACATGQCGDYKVCVPKSGGSSSSTSGSGGGGGSCMQSASQSDASLASIAFAAGLGIVALRRRRASSLTAPKAPR